MNQPLPANTTHHLYCVKRIDVGFISEENLAPLVKALAHFLDRPCFLQFDTAGAQILINREEAEHDVSIIEDATLARGFISGWKAAL
jgi:hypothetical protein